MSAEVSSPDRDRIVSHCLQGDCLHYHLPATPDAWAFVFFNLLAVYAPCRLAAANSSSSIAVTSYLYDVLDHVTSSVSACVDAIVCVVVRV